MELQKQFSTKYLIALKNNVTDPECRKKYENSYFDIEENEDNIEKIPGLYNKHVDLIISDSPKDDFENAKIFFEAYKDMTPLVASQEELWTYLTHAEYFEYVKKRWKISSETSPESMIEHFFVGGKVLKFARNGVARLWWPVYLTYDEGNKDPYHLTKILFSNTEVIQDMTESQFFSVKPLTHGILEYFEEHPDIKPTKVNIKKIMSYFNAYGGVRELVFETKDTIKQIIKDEIFIN